MAELLITDPMAPFCPRERALAQGTCPLAKVMCGVYEPGVGACNVGECYLHLLERWVRTLLEV